MEFARVRTEWVGERAARGEWGLADFRREAARSGIMVNAAVNKLVGVFEAVDHARAPEADLNWLADEDDRPVMQTALAAEADVLVTEDGDHFPIGETRNGILILDTRSFLNLLFEQNPEAQADIADYLRALPFHVDFF